MEEEEEVPKYQDYWIKKKSKIVEEDVNPNTGNDENDKEANTFTRITNSLPTISNPLTKINMPKMSNPLTNITMPTMSNPLTNMTNPLSDISNPLTKINNPLPAISDSFTNITNPLPKISNPFASAIT